MASENNNNSAPGPRHSSRPAATTSERPPVEYTGHPLDNLENDSDNARSERASSVDSNRRDPTSVIPDSQESSSPYDSPIEDRPVDNNPSGGVNIPARDPTSVIPDSQESISAYSSPIKGRPTEDTAADRPTEDGPIDTTPSWGVNIPADDHQMVISHSSSPTKDMTEALDPGKVLADESSTQPAARQPIRVVEDAQESPTSPDAVDGPTSHDAVDGPGGVVVDDQSHPLPDTRSNVDVQAAEPHSRKSKGLVVHFEPSETGESSTIAETPFVPHMRRDDAPRGDAMEIDGDPRLADARGDAMNVDDLVFEGGEWSGCESADMSDSDDDGDDDDYGDLVEMLLVEEDMMIMSPDDDEEEAAAHATIDSRVDRQAVDRQVIDLSRPVMRADWILTPPSQEEMVTLGMLPSTVSINDAAVQRFERLFASLVQRVAEECKILVGSEYYWSSVVGDRGSIAFAPSVVIWITREVRDHGMQALIDGLLQSIPLATRSVLGRENLTLEDLLDLPSFVPELQLWGTYVNVPSQPGHVDPRCYVGSGTAAVRGIVNRVRMHLNVCKNKIPVSDNNMHWEYLRQPSVTCNLRVLSLAEMKWRSRSSQHILEGMLAGFLNTANRSRDHVVVSSTGWSAKAANEEVAIMRDQAEKECGDKLPDMSRAGLNTMQPFRQGMTGSASYGPGLPVPASIKECADCHKKVPSSFEGWASISGTDVPAKDRWTAALLPDETVGVICSGCLKLKIAVTKRGNLVSWREDPSRTESDLEADEYCRRCKKPRHDRGQWYGRGKDTECQTCRKICNKAKKLGRDVQAYWEKHRAGKHMGVQRPWSARSDITGSQKEADKHCCRCGAPKPTVRGKQPLSSIWHFRGKRALCNRCYRSAQTYAKLKGAEVSRVLQKFWVDLETSGRRPPPNSTSYIPVDFISQGLQRQDRDNTELPQWEPKPKPHPDDKCWNCGAPWTAGRNGRHAFGGKQATCRKCYQRIARRYQGSGKKLYDIVKRLVDAGEGIPAPSGKRGRPRGTKQPEGKKPSKEAKKQPSKEAKKQTAQKAKKPAKEGITIFKLANYHHTADFASVGGMTPSPSLASSLFVDEDEDVSMEEAPVDNDDPLSQWLLVETSGDELLCAINAVIISMHEQFRDVEPPTEDELHDLRRRFQERPELYENNLDQLMVEDDMMVNNNNLTVDQLSWMVEHWGRDHGVRVRLGAIYPNQGSNQTLIPSVTDEDEDGLEIVWVYSNAMGDSEARIGGMGHWSGLMRKE